MVDNLQQFIDDVAVEVYGMTRTEALQEKKCVACNHKVKMFSNKISADEYNISALCETCQAETFDSASIDETVKNYAHLYNWGVKDSLWSKIAVVEDKVATVPLEPSMLSAPLISTSSSCTSPFAFTSPFLKPVIPMLVPPLAIDFTQ